MSSHSIAEPKSSDPRVSLEHIRPKMAKASGVEPGRDIQKQEPNWRQRIGLALRKAIAMAGWSHKEAACELGGRDEAQIGRWVRGEERQNLEAILAVERLRPAFLVALCELDQEIEIMTVMRVRNRRRAA